MFQIAEAMGQSIYTILDEDYMDVIMLGVILKEEELERKAKIESYGK